MPKRQKAEKAKKSSAFVAEEALHRTFHIRCAGRRGTCFGVDVDGHQYLMTASHLLRGLKDSAVVEVLHGGKWKPLDVHVVGVGPAQVDITVLALKFRIALPEFSLMASAEGLMLGQDVYCLGFPAGEWMASGGQAQRFPLPFVKRACVASLPESANVVRCLYLEGRSNPGFSGGPVVFRPEGGGPLRVAAVISTFQYENEPVYLGSDQVHVSAQQNSDLIVSYDVKHALDLITLNPIGFELKTV